jgi:hypothetical protein
VRFGLQPIADDAGTLMASCTTKQASCSFLDTPRRRKAAGSHLLFSLAK